MRHHIPPFELAGHTVRFDDDDIEKFIVPRRIRGSTIPFSTKFRGRQCVACHKERRPVKSAVVFPRISFCREPPQLELPLQHPSLHRGVPPEMVDIQGVSLVGVGLKPTGMISPTYCTVFFESPWSFVLISHFIKEDLHSTLLKQW